MKKITYHFTFTLAVILLLTTSCEKENVVVNIDYPPIYGKWKSISHNSGSSWVAIAQPHYIEIKNQLGNNFSYRDNNAVLCEGFCELKTADNVYYLNFPSSACGFTKRTIHAVNGSLQDTIELRVVTPPNITEDKVRYVRN